MMPIPWPQEFTPRYHRQRNFDRRWREQLRPLRWQWGPHKKKNIHAHRGVGVYLRPRGRGRKLAWQGNWHENTKGIAQLRSFFGNVDERVWSWGVLVRWNVRPTYWGDVCWRGRGREHMIILCCRSKRMRKFSKPNLMIIDWGRFKGPPSATE